MNTLNAKQVQVQADNKQAIKVSFASDLLSMSITFSHGKELIVKREDFSEDILKIATLHGLKQKLVDTAAIARDTVTGQPATIETKYQAIAEMYERLKNDLWFKEREGGSNEGGILLAALLRLYSGRLTSEQVKEYLKKLDNKQKLALKLDPKVSKVIREIEKEKSKDVNSSDLLAGLEALGE